MDSEKVSVIVPIYNAERYLQRCVDSILKQSYKDLDVILVNDGSTDNSECICDEYVVKDKRIKILSQTNQGPALARKHGVERAEGNYLIFVDSDDYIDEEYIDSLISYMNHCDLVTTGYINEKNGNKYFDVLEKGNYDTDERLEHLIDNMICFGNGYLRGITSFIFNKMFKTELIRPILNNICPRIYYGEDSELLYRYILECRSVVITDICGYHYCYNEQSIVHSKHEDFLINLNERYLSLKKVFSSHPRSNVLMYKLQQWTCADMRNALDMMGFNDMVKQNISYIYPFYSETKTMQVVLYGAGKVGQDYYKQLRFRKDVHITLWVDKDYEKYDVYGVRPISEIIECKYDYIVISVRNVIKVTEIRQDLTKMGIPAEKILWKEPETLVV